MRVRAVGGGDGRAGCRQPFPCLLTRGGIAGVGRWSCGHWAAQLEEVVEEEGGAEGCEAHAVTESSSLAGSRSSLQHPR